MTWLYLPLVCLPESACLTKESLPHSDFTDKTYKPFAEWNGSLVQPRNLSRLWKNNSLIWRLYGLTLPLLTLKLGAGKWIASLPDSPVKTYLLPELEPDLTAKNQGYFTKFCELQPIAVRSGCFWKTSQESLLPQLPLWTKKTQPSMSKITNKKAFRLWALKMDAWTKEPLPGSWASWPTQGGTRNGCIYERMKLVLRTDANDGFALRGAQCQTMKASEDESGVGTNSRSKIKLKTQAQNWPTPDCNTSTYSNGMMGPNLRERAANWATIRSSDWKGGVLDQNLTRKDGRTRLDQLQNQVTRFLPLVPQAQSGSELLLNDPTLRQRLNPTFAAWLMGWPAMWTHQELSGLGQPEMELYRCKLDAHMQNLLSVQ